MRRRAGMLVGIAMLLSPGAAHAVPTGHDAAKRTKRAACKAPSTSFVVDAKRGTVKPGTGKHARCVRLIGRRVGVQALATRLERSVLRPTGRYRALGKDSRGMKRSRSLGTKLIARGATVRARTAAREITRESGPVTDSSAPPGAKMHAERSSESGDRDSEVGRTDSSEVTVELTREAGQPRVTKRQGEGAFAPICPDADGIVRGEGVYLQGESRSVVADGRRAFLEWDLKVEMKFTGQVGDDARARTMDVVANGSIEYRQRVEHAKTGRLLSREGTKVLRFHVTRQRIDPRNPYPPEAAENYFDNRTINARGPKGSDLVTDPKKFAGIVDGLALTEATAVLSAARILLRAEQYWYGEGAEITTHSDGEAFTKDGRPAGRCVKLAFDPEPVDIKPGETKPVGIRVLAKDGSEVPLANLKLAPVTGPVSPAAAVFRAGTPVVADFTMPADSKYDGIFASFNAEATSKRGRARISHTARNIPSIVHFDITFAGEGSYSHALRTGETDDPQDATASWTHTTRFFKVPVVFGDPASVIREPADSAAFDGSASAITHSTAFDGPYTCTWPLRGLNGLGHHDSPGGRVFYVRGGQIDRVPAGNGQSVRDCSDSSEPLAPFSPTGSNRYTVQFTLSDEQMRSGETISIPARSPVVPSDCRSETNFVECERTWGWTGTVTLRPVAG